MIQLCQSSCGVKVCEYGDNSWTIFFFFGGYTGFIYNTLQKLKHRGKEKTHHDSQSIKRSKPQE